MWCTSSPAIWMNCAVAFPLSVHCARLSEKWASPPFLPRSPPLGISDLVVLRHRAHPGVRPLHSSGGFHRFCSGLLPCFPPCSFVPKRPSQTEPCLQRSASPWTPWLSRWFIPHPPSPQAILITTGFFTLVSIGLVTNIEVNNFLLEDLREDDPLRQEFNFFERSFAGVRPYELALEFEAGRDIMSEPKVLATVDSVELAQEDVGAGSVLGPPTAARTCPSPDERGPALCDRIPEGPALEKLLKRLSKWGKNNSNAIESRLVRRGQHGHWTGPHHRQNRRFGRQGVGQTKRQIPSPLGRTLGPQLRIPPFTAHITGTASLIDLNNRFSRFGHGAGLLIAFAAVALIVGLLFGASK